MIQNDHEKYSAEQNLKYIFIILFFNIIAFSRYIMLDIFNKRTTIYDRASDKVYNLSGVNVQQLLKAPGNTLLQMAQRLFVIRPGRAARE
ncbi:hypothetical protein FEM41_04775 [Jejubacter calystegiae]|uniref:Uncharacterized protein n=1 Tax=Jejubacter calystegiae TaxID=2579935 RepID=A0A4P8YKN4_9ENTR|nr:hypothetical protein [Jejubacter calystegiae]QCT19012.1 hypothetical protein FEM41_04775 [Jejubacter calystegiae]